MPKKDLPLQSILSELERRRAPKTLVPEFCADFPKQAKFLEDESPWVVADCSRRAGKTSACAFDLLQAASGTPDTVCLYVTTTRVNAKRIFWPVLKKVSKDYGFQGVPNESDLGLKLPNGSVIYVVGAPHLSALDNYLGMPLLLVYVDEAQSFPEYLHELLDRVIAPALMDYAGRIKVIGTPAALPSGPFWDLLHNAAWSRHSWTFFDNPHIPRKARMSHQAVLERELRRRGVPVTDPSIRRDWFGEWREDRDSLVIQYDETKNHYDELPRHAWRYVFGIDLGFDDADAIAVLAWSPHSPNLYLVEEFVESKLTISELADRVQKLSDKYKPDRMVVDTGGLGKKITEELVRRFKIPVVAAEKTRKLEFVKLMNDALQTGRLKANKASRFACDSRRIEWDRDRSRGDKRVVSLKFHSDVVDAVLYAFRESLHWTHQTPTERPKPGTVKAYDEEAERLEKAAEEYFRRKQEEEDRGW